jgi:hypothetical protein
MGLLNTTPNTFEAYTSEHNFSRAVARFLAERQPAVPVWVGTRKDLVNSILLAETIYSGVHLPEPAAVGFWLGESILAARAMAEPLARRWLGANDLPAFLEQAGSATILVSGVYDRLNSCKNAQMPNGRCRMHGGTATGARTPEGIERIRQANTKHGAYSQEHQDFMRRIRKMQQSRRKLIGQLKELATVNPQALRNSGLSPERVLGMPD